MTGGFIADVALVEGTEYDDVRAFALSWGLAIVLYGHVLCFPWHRVAHVKTTSDQLPNAQTIAETT